MMTSFKGVFSAPFIQLAEILRAIDQTRMTGRHLIYRMLIFL